MRKRQWRAKEVSNYIADRDKNISGNSAISAGMILCMRPANERRRYNVTSSLICMVHSQNDRYISTVKSKVTPFSVNLQYFSLPSNWVLAACETHTPTWHIEA